MNWGEILVANGTGLFLLIMLIICRNMTKLTRRPVDKIFSAIILIGIAGTILEPLTFLLNGKEGSFYRAVSMFSNTLEFFCTATVSVLWVWYVDLYLNKDIKRLKTRFVPMIVIWALLTILLIANIFGEFLFSFDEHNVYSREPLGYIFFVFLSISYLASVVLYYRFLSIHGKAQFFPIWMFLTPLIISLSVQILFYGLSVTFLGCAVGLVSIYLNILSKQSLVDSLTGLYNRAYIEHELIIARRSRKYIYSGVMLDIDQFKSINDNFGHSSGDDALENASKIIIGATDRDSLAFRLAGDEFVVLVRAKVGKTEELKSKTLDLEERIRAGMEAFNNMGEKTYKVVFSMGYALYDTNFGDDDFFRKMDAEMYKDKENKRKAM